MSYKKKLIILAIVIVLLTIMELIMPGNPGVMQFYTRYIFRPYQSIRNILFGYLPFSIGDLLYCAGILLCVLLIIRWMYLLIRVRTHKGQFGHSTIHTLITVGIFYILFIIGWGANYYKPRLADYWQMERFSDQPDSQLARFDRFLVSELNEYAPHYHTLSFKTINKNSRIYYKQYTDSKAKLSGLGVKPSLFNFLMQHLGIQGYYNPFTGESQVNRFLPSFMLPFVICHEMAHQSGVANEGDANLMAYVLSTATQDSAFHYSAYLNLWLYVNNRYHYKDSASAKKLQLELNQLTLSHIDTLREIRRRYEGVLSDYSGRIYDEYLRLHRQKGGIRSYGDVVMAAWTWEQKRNELKDKVIKIP